MPRYKVNGRITIEYTYYAYDEEVEADNEDDAIDAICEDFLPGDEDSCETDAYGVTVTLIEDPPEPTEDARMRALGMPLLPGIE